MNALNNQIGINSERTTPTAGEALNGALRNIIAAQQQQDKNIKNVSNRKTPTSSRVKLNFETNSEEPKEINSFDELPGYQKRRTAKKMRENIFKAVRNPYKYFFH